MDDAKWYVVHTYSGYENKVKANIEKTVENRNLHDQILEVIVPLETVDTFFTSATFLTASFSCDSHIPSTCKDIFFSY